MDLNVIFFFSRRNRVGRYAIAIPDNDFSRTLFKICLVKTQSEFQSYNILGGNLNYLNSNKCSRPAKNAAGILCTLIEMMQWSYFIAQYKLQKALKLRNMHISLTCQIGIECPINLQ